MDPRALDIGCGAGRNAVPLARLGWSLVGADLSWPMLSTGAEPRPKPGTAANGQDAVIYEALFRRESPILQA